MNMENYRLYKRLLAFLQSNDKTLTGEKIPHYNYTTKHYDKKKYYNAIGAKTETEIETAEKKRTEFMMDNINYGMKTAHYFEIDKIEKRLLLLTEAPHDKRILKRINIPFDTMFLDVNFKREEVNDKYDVDFDEVFGILIMRCATDESQIDKQYGHKIKENAEGKGSAETDSYYIAYAGQLGQTSFINDIIIPVDMKNSKVFYHDKRDIYFFRDFIINLMLFINHPEVETINIIRSQKNTQRRIKRGLMPLPSSIKIKLTGKIKRYVNSLGNTLTGDGFDFKFWVMGHFRVYRSEVYTNMQGKIAWIEPYLKGQGEIRQQIRLISADKDDEKEYHGRFLFLDDIEPLKKPLREVKENEPKRL